MRQSDKSTRKPRADAVRNRERVLEAAKAVFSAGGADASLEAVARGFRVLLSDSLMPSAPRIGGLKNGGILRISGGEHADT